MRKKEFRGWHSIETLHATSLTCRMVLVLLFMIIAGNPLSAQTITNISVTQRSDGSGLIDVYYTITGTAVTYYISMEASFNNVSTFSPIASNYLTGHIGAVAPGSGRHIVWNGKGSNNNTYSTQAKVKLIANTDVPCGQTLTINHIAGEVAPVTKTTTYGTVTGIPGEPTKCWITSNLGSDHQATSVDDATEASAGWYWQFNRKQGYKHDGTTFTPTWTITNINENSDWLTQNDPCSLGLGNIWRIPTYSEWNNVDNAGAWINWNGLWNSGLKLHAAGGLDACCCGLYSRGSAGYYWSRIQQLNEGGWGIYFYFGGSNLLPINKAEGYPLRCLSDNQGCILPISPTEETHVSSQTQIIWNWNTVLGATGYKWNTANDFATAIDMGVATTKTEIGLTSNTYYTRYVWAYNDCGVSSVSLIASQTTEFVIGQNYGGGIIFYLDSTGQHGLIAATSDQSSIARWGCYGNTIGGTSTAIGYGLANTILIANGCITIDIAANLCNNLFLNGYDDWFLPSLNELSLMNLEKNLIGGFSNGTYWSSSELNNEVAYTIYFYSGDIMSAFKYSGCNVRAVRAF